MADNTQTSETETSTENQENPSSEQQSSELTENEQPTDETSTEIAENTSENTETTDESSDDLESENEEIANNENQESESFTEKNNSTELNTESNPPSESELASSEELESQENEGEVEENNIAPQKTKQEIKTEVLNLPEEVAQELYKQTTPAEEIGIGSENYESKVEELIADNPSVTNKLSNQAKVMSLNAEIDGLKNTNTGDLSGREKLDKKIAKLEKKKAKIEVKNYPVILKAATDSYEGELSQTDAEIIEREAEVSKSAPLLQQIQKLRAEAEVYNEDAEIYKGLAEKTNKKDVVKKEELYKEATAKQLAASQNLEKVNWLLDNTETLAELSPDAFEALVEDQNLAADAIEEAEIASENAYSLEFADMVLELEDSLSTPEELALKWDLDSAEKEKAKKSTAYVNYESKTNELSENVNELLAIQTELQTTQTRARALTKQADEIESTLDEAKSDAEKENFTKEVKRLRAAASVAYQTADSLTTQKAELLAESQSLKQELLTLENELTSGAPLLAENSPEDTTPAEIQPEENTTVSMADVESAYSRSLDLSTAVNQTIFAKTKNVYSETRPIPVDIKLPEGLVYKVQVGAFRNPIPQSLYNDFAPVAGEQLNNGITRYTAGLFTAETQANSAKTDIRGLGFSDAFVVAYFNGERISLAEARNLGGAVATNPVADNSAVQNTNTTTQNPEQRTENRESETSNVQPSVTERNIVESNVRTSNSETFQPTETADDYYESFPEAAEANQIEVLSGLFYTVQVGVYSKPVPANQIFNISPLNSERLANNNIRYTTGIYNNLQEASNRKTQVQNIGISDAFITAYYNGKRISISEAKQKFQESGIEITEVSNQLEDNRSTTTSESSSTEEAPAVQKEYIIYIGTFKDEVPANVAKAMLFLEESRGIVQNKNGEEVTYTTRPVKSEATARIIQQEFESYEVYGTEIREVE